MDGNVHDLVVSVRFNTLRMALDPAKIGENGVGAANKRKGNDGCGIGV
jgi:hypothetical protein